MKKDFWIIVVLILLLASCSLNSEIPISNFSIPGFEMVISDRGMVSAMNDTETGINHLAQDSIAPLLSLRVNGIYQNPLSATSSGDILYLQFEEHREAKIKVTEKSTYITFELKALSDSNKVDLVLWGPYPTSIQKIIGETVGVVRGETLSLIHI